MITLYTGVPGAGKSYKMVADLDAFIDDYEQKRSLASAKEGSDEIGPLTVITNVRDLKLPHIEFNEFIIERFPDKSLKVTERIELFFDYDYQRGLNEHFGGPIMYVIDECQMFFPKRTSLPNTEAYLQRHRHLGHNIYLATQAIRQVNGNVICLVELELFAAPRTKSLFGEFRYHVKVPNSRDILNVVNIRPKQRIFDLYKSFDAKELQKPKKLLLRKLWPLLLLPVGFYLFYVGIGRIGGPLGKEQAGAKQQVSSTIGAPAPGGAIDATMSNMAAVQRQEPEIERVFLTIIKTGDKSLTIDPDTQAVVEVKRLGRRVVCVNEGLTCFYDRKVTERIKVADTSMSGSSSSGSQPYRWPAEMNGALMPSTLPAPVSEGPGAFLEPSLVPLPDVPR